MKWDTIQLGEVLDVKHGYAFESEFYADQGDYILLTPGNCNESGGLKLKGDKEKFFTGEFPAEFLLNKDDMLVVMTDLINSAPILGGSFLIPEDNKFLHNQRLGLVEVTQPNRIDRQFLYYLFNTHGYRGQVRGSASGATVRHTSPARIKACTVRVPHDVSDQKRIGEALAVYDDLIENNRRRMALLQDAARLLYQEWFIRLRFPGHTHTKIHNGIPEGWDRVPFEEALVLQRGFDLPETEWEEGGIPICGSTGIIGYHNKLKAKGPGVFTGRSGSLGVVNFIEVDYWPHNTSLWVREFKRVSALFALFLLRNMRLEQYNGGVSVPTLDRKAIHRVPVLIPPSEMISRFDEKLNPVFAQIANLRLQNQKLRTARDLLLPRIMSGEIEV